MFKGCSKLTNIDLSKMNIQNLTNINGLFMGCSSLTSISMGKLVPQNIKYADKIFEGCNKISNSTMNSKNDSEPIKTNKIEKNTKHVIKKRRRRIKNKKM